ncbi:MAG: glycoside hydrolase family 38 C-terminal domain-containing protein [Thermoanaerobaculia bacterium]
MDPLDSQASVSLARPARPRLYVVALAHLDTQWQWTVRETAARFLPRTVIENEDRFRRFPNYRLNFEGACRYRLLEECHPALFETVRARVAEGRWFPSGAAWEAFDTHLPAPESIVRQLLLGTRYFERTLGIAGRDIFLPDCFGFSQALPTLAAHCGIAGFSTQKLRRGAEMRSAFGVPFPLGIWTGPDGAELLSALDPGEYGAQTEIDLSTDSAWSDRFAELKAAGRPLRLMTYQGLGDQGGALPAKTIDCLERSAQNDDGIDVVLATSEQVFLELPPSERDQLPRYDGELLLRLHATGCYSSRSQLKRWHRKAEQLAHATERAAAIAAALGVAAPPKERLRTAWQRILAHEMHDDLTGTSVPSAYRHSANDLAVTLGELHQELEHAIGAVATTLDAPGPGTSLVLYNPLGWARADLVEVELPLAAHGDVDPEIFGPEGQELPSQWRQEGAARVGRFVAALPALGFSVCEMRPAVGRNPASRSSPELRVGKNWLENSRLRVELDDNGDVSQIHDLRSGKQILSAPIALEIFDNTSVRFPSWEIRWEDTARPCRSRLAGPVSAVTVDEGPARVSVSFVREIEGSRFVQTVALVAGDAGDAVIIDVAIDWRTDAALLKMSFHMAAAAREALFDQGVGVARRPVANAGLYEVPAHQWAALRDAYGHGAAIANDCKYGWDHPTADTLRLTLLHTPRVRRRFRYQTRQDFGHHDLRVAIRPLDSDDSISAIARFAERLNQPLHAFVVKPDARERTRSAAPRPKTRSFLAIDSEHIAIQALKPAEDGEGLILRLRECSGNAADIVLNHSPGLKAAALVDGLERPARVRTAAASETRKDSAKGPGRGEVSPEPDPPPPNRWPDAGSLGPLELPPKISLKRFGLSALALHFDPPSASLLSLPTAMALRGVEWNCAAVLDRGERSRDGGLDGRGFSVPRELLPRSATHRGIHFDLSHAHRSGEFAGLRCAGQCLQIEAGFERLWLLAAAFPQQARAEFRIDGAVRTVEVGGGFSPLGRFDELERNWLGRPSHRVIPGFFEPAPVALVVPHRYDRRGRIDACRPIHFFAIDFPVSPTGSRIELPASGGIVLLAATVTTCEFPRATRVSPAPVR